MADKTPMTAERRREIEATHLSGLNAVWPGTDTARDVLDLLAEINRLNTALNARTAEAVMAEREACAAIARRGSDIQRGWIAAGVTDDRQSATLHSALREAQEIERAIRSRPAPTWGGES